MSSPSNALRPGEHLEEHDAERPDVRAPIDGLAARLLRRHVRRRPEDDAHLGRRARSASANSTASAPTPLGLAGSSALARPKSSTLTVPSRADFDVGRLQIAMDDALVVRGFERVGDLAGDRQRVRRPAAGPAR